MRSTRHALAGQSGPGRGIRGQHQLVPTEECTANSRTSELSTALILLMWIAQVKAPGATHDTGVKHGQMPGTPLQFPTTTTHITSHKIGTGGTANKLLGGF